MLGCKKTLRWYSIKGSKIEIFHEERDNGSVIKSVTFRFPIKLGGKQFEKIEVNGQTSGDLVETVVLMSRKDK